MVNSSITSGKLPPTIYLYEWLGKKCFLRQDGFRRRPILSRTPVTPTVSGTKGSLRGYAFAFSAIAKF